MKEGIGGGHKIISPRFIKAVRRDVDSGSSLCKSIKYTKIECFTILRLRRFRVIYSSKGRNGFRIPIVWIPRSVCNLVYKDRLYARVSVFVWNYVFDLPKENYVEI